MTQARSSGCKVLAFDCNFAQMSSMLLAPSTEIKKLSTSELFDLFGDEARKDRCKGWTSWQTSGLPDGRIMAAWGCDLRQLHNLKRNSTQLFKGDELLGEIRRRVVEHLWCMKRPPAGYKPPRRDPVELDREAKDWINRRRAARGEPPLPYMPSQSPVAATGKA
jgi:hypothetical protein